MMSIPSDDNNSESSIDDIPVESIKSYMSSYIPLPKYITNVIETYGDAIDPPHDANTPKICVLIPDLKKSKSDVFSSAVSKAINTSNSTEVGCVIIDLRHLGRLNFATSEKATAEIYQTEQSKSHLLWGKAPAITKVILQIRWVDYAPLLLSYLVACCFPPHCATLVIDIDPSPDPHSPHLARPDDMSTLSNVLSAIARHSISAMTVTQLAIRRVPNAAESALGKALAAHLPLLPRLERLSVTSATETAGSLNNVKGNAVVLAKCFHLHPTLRVLQLHSPQRHWLPLYLLTGATPYGYLDHTQHVEWAPLVCNALGGVTSLISSNSSSNVEMSDLELELSVQLILLNSYTSQVQVSHSVPAVSHTAMLTRLQEEQRKYAEAVCRSETCFTVLMEWQRDKDRDCCTIRRSSSGGFGGRWGEYDTLLHVYMER